MSIRRHTAYNLLGAVIPMGLSLLTIPIYMRLIGDVRYGVLAILWSFLGYFGVLDLGLGRATAQRIASLGESSPALLASAFWTALAINAALGAFGALLIWPASNLFFGHFITMDAQLKPELASALVWLALALPLMLLSSVLTGALEGRSQFRELSLISVTGAALFQLLPLLVASAIGPDLTFLLPAVLFGRLLSVALAFWRCKIHVFQNIAPALSRAEAKALLRFGGWVTVSSLVGPLMVILDRLMIGAGAGTKAVTYYSAPFQLAERFNVLAGALNAALFPRLALADKAERHRLTVQAMGLLAAATTPMIVTAILLVEPFFGLWIGPEFAAKANVTDQILLLGFWCNGLASFPLVQLQASGQPHIVAKCHLLELVPYFLLLFFGLAFWGLPGAAFAFSLRTFSDFILLLYLAGDLRAGLNIIKTPVLLLLLALSFSLLGPDMHKESVWRWLEAGGLILTALAWSWRSSPPAVRDLGWLAFKKFCAHPFGAMR